MAEFRDATGRPGPSTWEVGTYRRGHDEAPVSGVSWYEAAAYAAFAGRPLPTIYPLVSRRRVRRASSPTCSRSATSAAGGRCRLAPRAASGRSAPPTWPATSRSGSGTRAATAAASCSAAPGSRRPTRSHDEDARAPFTRDAGFGFRCMRQRRAARDVALDRAGGHAGARSGGARGGGRRAVPRPTNGSTTTTRVRSTRASTSATTARPHWITERVSFTAAYGSERVPLMLMLPRAGTPPYPGGDLLPRLRCRAGPVEPRRVHAAGAVPAARAAVPSRSRSTSRPTSAAASRPAAQLPARDQHPARPGRAPRHRLPGDAARHRHRPKIAFYGVSLGAQLAPVYLAVEPRLRTGVLLSGGFETWTIPAESRPGQLRAAGPPAGADGERPRRLRPALRDRPGAALHGARHAAADKRHVVLDGGHIPPRPQDVFKEILDWLDRYLGPVGQ